MMAVTQSHRKVFAAALTACRMLPQHPTTERGQVRAMEMCFTLTELMVTGMYLAKLSELYIQGLCVSLCVYFTLIQN